MSDNPIEINDAKDKSQNQIIREEINLQFHLYITAFLIIYLSSWVIPGVIIWFFISFFYIPYFLNIKEILILFTNLRSLLTIFSLPIVLIISYLIHLFFVAFITRLIWRYTERKSPSKDGIIPRNVPSKILNFYHFRSFLIKYPKHAFNRGPFPWLINWLYNFVGANEIGRNSTIEEQFGADKFVKIGDNSYIGVNSGFSSHSVDGIFGNVVYFKIRVGDNVTTSALNNIAPGVEINNDSYLLPMAGATKHSTLEGGQQYYYGVPLRKIYSRKVAKYLGIEKEDIKRAENFKKEK
ncbi:MAG: hypothetical protein GF317_19090 [Candidatus Lokiarchaeota archaeon]|nr:hypothetical protein [Candidatus Lokiarchaeota archaeon]MBD3201618.1 hypothetical protein [Candidatus Lokiarchaeota archaeon]